MVATLLQVQNKKIEPMPKVFIKNMQTLMPKNRIHELIHSEFMKLHRNLYANKQMAVQAIQTAYNQALLSYSGRAVAPELKHFSPDQHSDIYHIDTCYMHLIDVNEEA